MIRLRHFDRADVHRNLVILLQQPPAAVQGGHGMRHFPWNIAVEKCRRISGDSFAPAAGASVVHRTTAHEAAKHENDAGQDAQDDDRQWYGHGDPDVHF